MAVQTVPYALQNASHSAALFRQSASAAFVSGGALSSVELAVSPQGSPNMSVILGPGRAKVPGTSVSPPAGQSWTTQAMYDILNDANVTLTIAASNPTNPRIDLVYVQVQDSFYSGAANQAIAGVVTGTPAPSPAVPATPANAVGVALVAVGAGVTSIVSGNISRIVNDAGVRGAILSFATKSAMDAFVPDAPGRLARPNDLPDSEFRWSGSAWVQVGPGLIPIVPSSVVNGTINPDGSVSITGAPASVSLNGVFTSRFRNYRIVLTLEGSAIGGFLRLRAGGVDDSAALYRVQTLQISSATVSGSFLATNTGLAFATVAGVRHDQEIIMYSPQLAEPTRAFQNIASWASGSTLSAVIQSMLRDVTTAYDGFSLVVTAGTGFAGRITVYGLV